MELKLDMLARASQALSPAGDRTILLRAIANLGATKDGYDCIDLTNNEIQKLDNIPLLPRLRTLIVAGNRISKIATDLHQSLPNLTSLVLTGNNITHLSDLEPLFNFKRLERLSLVDNPVIALPHFREYVSYRLPSLRYLNFSKVTQKERTLCDAYFKSNEGKSFLRDQGYDVPSTSGSDKNKEILAMLEKTSDVDKLLQLEKQLLS
ncbi:putative U2 small nuclear ribonucleoprotein A' [Babesia divergens]|uniref:U2 small nuclear ribonucleoprotein A n=1 Tax=Babesia divergens TaxID=32595 RepID=A0AAD9GAB8_BABDI|nr:putative U2 small nuclear ribonucleoprotein A' [Babesia divergens]